MSKAIGSVLFLGVLLLSGGLLLYSMQSESEDSQVKLTEEANPDDASEDLVETESESPQVAATIDSPDDDSESKSTSAYYYTGRSWTDEELAAAHPEVYAAFSSWYNDDGSFRDEDTPLFTLFDVDLESDLAHYDGVQDNGTQNKVGIFERISESYPEHVPLIASLASAEYNAERDATLIAAGHEFVCEERYWNVSVISGGDTDDGILLEIVAFAGSDACENRDGYFRENWLIVDGNLQLEMRSDEFVPYVFR